MPKLPIDYSNTIIYKIICKNPDITDCYVGHTTNFNKRKQHHKEGCFNRNYPVYKFIREHEGWENFSMIQIEEFSCKNLREAEIRERYWIETLKSNLNYKIPTRTAVERYEEEKERFDEKAKIYREQNVDKIKESKANYFQDHKKEIYEKRKIYNELNKEKIKEYKQNWYLKNKNKNS